MGIQKLRVYSRRCLYIACKLSYDMESYQIRLDYFCTTYRTIGGRSPTYLHGPEYMTFKSLNLCCQNSSLFTRSETVAEIYV